MKFYQAKKIVLVSIPHGSKDYFGDFTVTTWIAETQKKFFFGTNT